MIVAQQIGEVGIATFEVKHKCVLTIFADVAQRIGNTFCIGGRILTTVMLKRCDCIVRIESFATVKLDALAQLNHPRFGIG